MNYIKMDSFKVKPTQTSDVDRHYSKSFARRVLLKWIGFSIKELIKKKEK